MCICIYLCVFYRFRRKHVYQTITTSQKEENNLHTNTKNKKLFKDQVILWILSDENDLKCAHKLCLISFRCCCCLILFKFLFFYLNFYLLAIKHYVFTLKSHVFDIHFYILYSTFSSIHEQNDAT